MRATRRKSRKPCRPTERTSVQAAFFNAGTEAVENAVKFARAYTGRPAVIAQPLERGRGGRVPERP